MRRRVKGAVDWRLALPRCAAPAGVCLCSPAVFCAAAAQLRPAPALVGGRPRALLAGAAAPQAQWGPSRGGQVGARRALVAPPPLLRCLSHRSPHSGASGGGGPSFISVTTRKNKYKSSPSPGAWATFFTRPCRVRRRTLAATSCFAAKWLCVRVCVRVRCVRACA